MSNDLLGDNHLMINDIVLFYPRLQQYSQVVIKILTHACPDT